MEQIKLNAVLREEKGKLAVKKLRSQGLIPGVVYHRGDVSVPVSIPEKDFSRVIHTSAGENALISLTIEKEKRKTPRPVLIKELQHDPVKRNVIHVDFHEISLTEKIEVDIQIIIKGEAPGVKNEGGVLEHPMHEVKIECLPTEIPPHIDVDISALKLNDSVHVKDLTLPSGVKTLTDGELLVVQVKLPRQEKEEEEAAAPGEVEVITEKKAEEGAEAPEKAPAEEPKAKEGAKPEKK